MTGFDIILPISHGIIQKGGGSNMINLIFDVDDTLYDQLVPFESAYLKIFGREINIPSEDLFKSNRKYSEGAFKCVEDGNLSIEEMHIHRITKAFEDFNMMINPAAAKDFQAEYVNNQGKITLLEGMKNVLDFGRENNLKMGIITNGPTNHQYKKMKVLGLNKWIDDENIFISGSLNVSKPDEKIFKIVEEKMNISPKYTYYIGDSIKNDIMGAKKAGWKMIWLNRRGETLPPGLDFYPDYIINDDKKLISLLHKIYNGYKAA